MHDCRGALPPAIMSFINSRVSDCATRINTGFWRAPFGMMGGIKNAVNTAITAIHTIPHPRPGRDQITPDFFCAAYINTDNLQLESTPPSDLGFTFKTLRFAGGGQIILPRNRGHEYTGQGHDRRDFRK